MPSSSRINWTKNAELRRRASHEHNRAFIDPVEACLRELDRLARDYGSDFPRSAYEGTVNQLAGRWVATEAEIREEVRYPLHVTLVALSRTLPHLLSSGAFHLSKGMLSAEGAKLICLWSWVLHRMLCADLLTEEDAEFMTQLLSIQIELAG